MKRMVNNPSILVVVICLAIFALGQVSYAKQSYVPGQQVMKLKSGGQIKSIEKRYGAVVIDSLDGEGTYLVAFPDKDGDGPPPGLARESKVDWFHPNYIIDLPETFQISQGFPDQNAPVYAFGMSPREYYQQPSTYSTGLDSALTVATGQGVKIAIIDNGLDYDHPIIADLNLVSGYDYIDYNNDPSETIGSYYGHGTFVTSLAWLAAPDAEILPIRVFDAEGQTTVFKLVQGIVLAALSGAEVINISGGTTANSTLLRVTIETVVSSGITVVAATGNAGTSVPYYPAAYSGVIAVGAIDQDERRADFSSFGDHVDVMAPGVSVYGAMAGNYDWGTWTGTSFAAPVVSGTIALMLQAKPPDDDDDKGPQLWTETHVRATARSNLMWGTFVPPSNSFGYGVVDAFNATASLMIGDINASGGIDISDMQLLSSMVRQGDKGNDQTVQARLADVNCDGKVDRADVDFLADYFNGKRATRVVCIR